MQSTDFAMGRQAKVEEEKDNEGSFHPDELDLCAFWLGDQDSSLG